MRSSVVSVDIDPSDWETDEPTATLPPPLPIPLTGRLTPGVVCARFQVPMTAAVLGAAAFGVLFDRVLRRWC